MTKPKKDIDLRLKEAQLKKWNLDAKKAEVEIRMKRLKNEEKLKNLCRIDIALDAMDEFLKPWVEFTRNLPDIVYEVTKCEPEQYVEIQKRVENIFHVMAERRIHLAIESTQEQKDKATQKWYESMSKNQNNE